MNKIETLFNLHLDIEDITIKFIGLEDTKKISENRMKLHMYTRFLETVFMKCDDKELEEVENILSDDIDTYVDFMLNCSTCYVPGNIAYYLKKYNYGNIYESLIELRDHHRSMTPIIVEEHYLKELNKYLNKGD